MSIFRREPESEFPPPTTGQRVQRPTPETSGKSSLIAPGTRITGELNGSTDLVVEGEVEGQVRLDATVTVGSGGLVSGELEARVVRISGKVVGNVRGRERVEILPSGVVQGDVVAPRVVISDGAFLKGRVEMSDAARPARGVPEVAARGAAAVPASGETPAQPTLPSSPATRSEGGK